MTAQPNLSLRPRRSVLYMPGANQRALEKARTLAADTLVLDLEDSVGPDKKVLAREQVLAAVAHGGYGSRELVVRVNGLDSAWGEADLIALARAGADAVCLPKVESAAEIERALAVLDAAGAPLTLALWAMIETPRGVLNAQYIAAAHPRLTVLAMGTTDLAKELRVPHTLDRIGLQAALSHCVLAARAAGVDILDGVYLDLEDEAGFAHACEQGRALGFDGKTLIHPSQLSSANRVFGPSADDLVRADKIISAWRDTAAQGKGVVVVDGKLVESMHIDEAHRNLAIAAVIRDLQAQQ